MRNITRKIVNETLPKEEKRRKNSRDAQRISTINFHLKRE
jgi:hypothetical protein